MLLPRCCSLFRTFRKCFIYQRKLCSNLDRKLKAETEYLDVYTVPNSLSSTSDDLSNIVPYFPKTFNLAAYVNSSELLQNLVKLDVNISKIEKKPHYVGKILKLNFDTIKEHILFLKDHANADELGNILTKNPMILNETLADLEVRINYLQSKHFTKPQIERIVSKNPFWLMFSSTRIDKRLGYFQKKFNLTGAEVRLLTTKQPKLITYNLCQVNTNTFAIKEEMGFEDDDIKKLILNKPKLWMLNQLSLLRRFKYIHNTMNISHAMILLYPEILLCRNFKLRQRYLFLHKLGRNQFDPKKENYVPLLALVEGTDVEFCNKYARCNVNDFNIFLKTL